MAEPGLEDRALAAYLGFAIGDALVEAAGELGDFFAPGGAQGSSANRVQAIGRSALGGHRADGRDRGHVLLPPFIRPRLTAARPARMLSLHMTK